VLEKTMLRCAAVLAALFFLAVPDLLGAAQRKKPAYRPVKTAAHKVSSRATPHKSSKAVRSSRTTHSRRSTHGRTAVRARSHSYGPLSPTPERYREIQQALADKGFFKGAIDGNWGADSVQALKDFQQSANLDVDGKLGALSLIELGLGPKRSYASKAEVPQPDAPRAQ
jgi:hypothetical protein